MAADRQAEVGFRLVPLSALVPSRTNPRKACDEGKLAELTKNVQQHGVIEPLIVRRHKKMPDHYEVVVGERRLRAASRAKLDRVPVIVRDLSDVEALELQIIENGQREDVNPLDEGRGFQALLKKARYNAKTLAEKIDKPLAHVYERLKLHQELLPEAKKLFLKGDLTTGHAISIARLQPADQQRVLAECRQPWDGNRVAPVREMREWIDRSVHSRLHAAPFRMSDANLVPDAGACTKCPKRAGSNPEMYPDLKPDTCTDSECYESKVAAFIAGQPVEVLRVSTEYGNKPPKGALGPDSYVRLSPKETCPSATKAVVVDTYERGKLLKVCADRKCKTHWSGRRAVSAEEAKWRAQQRRAVEKRKRERRVREAILDAVLAKVPQRLKEWDLRLLVDVLIERTWHESVKRLCARRGLEPEKRQYGSSYSGPLRKEADELSGAVLVKFAVELALVDYLEGGERKWDALIEAAKHYGVDVAWIREEVAAAEKARAAKKRAKPVQTSAKQARAKKPVDQVALLVEGVPPVQTSAKQAKVKAAGGAP